MVTPARRDPVAGTRPVGEVHRIPVDRDEVDFGVRNGHRLHHVFDALMGPERTANGATAQLGRQEIVEPGVTRAPT